MFLQYAAPGAVVPLFSVWLEQLRFAPMAVSWVFATSAMASLVAPLLAGQIADRWVPVERCIACDNCAKACPVDCIYIESEGKGKNAKLTRFEIDYQKCLFCNLCVPPCPVDCIKMGKDFDLTGYTREDMVVPFHLGIRPIRQKTQVALEDIEKRKAEAAKAAAPKPA